MPPLRRLLGLSWLGSESDGIDAELTKREGSLCFSAQGALPLYTVASVFTCCARQVLRGGTGNPSPTGGCGLWADVGIGPYRGSGRGMRGVGDDAPYEGGKQWRTLCAATRWGY